MTAKKSSKRHSAKKAPRKASARKSSRIENPDAPTYRTNAEIKAARLAHGAHYDRHIEQGLLNAPTRDELSDADLDERLAKTEAKREGSTGKRSRSNKAASTDADSAPASEGTSSE